VTLYPFQWTWDAAFVALGPAASVRLPPNTNSVRCSGRRGTIACWPTSFPGTPRGIFGASRSGASTPTRRRAPSPSRRWSPRAHRLYERTGDDAFREAVRPALDRHLSWWVRERAVDGLVAVRHPWGTGMDDSPAWTPALAAFDPPEIAPGLAYERADRKPTALAAQRPIDWDDDHYVALVRQGRRLDWDEHSLRAGCPFRVGDPLTNAIFVRACEALAALHAAGDGRASRWREQAVRSRRTIRGCLWDDSLGTFVACDRVSDRPLPTRSIAGLVRTYGGSRPTRSSSVPETLAEFFGYPYVCPLLRGSGDGSRPLLARPAQHQLAPRSGAVALRDRRRRRPSSRGQPGARRPRGFRE